MRAHAVAAVAEALQIEAQLLDDLVAGLDDAGWSRPTPAEGWTVRHQIGHLALSEEWAALAATDPDAFAAMLADVVADLDAFALRAERQIGERDPAATLTWWRTGRDTTVNAVRALPDDTRIPWFGPPMSARSFLTARLMETWAHGQDVRDALGAEPSASDRLRDIAHLGVITRRFAYTNRGLEAPDADVRVELTSPSGATWTWGDEGLADRVAGDALDFCLVVTQRRNVADTALAVEGPAATDWLRIAQVFAGPPTDPRPPRSR